MADIEEIGKRINSVLDLVKPYLNSDGGDVEFVRFEESTGVAEVRLLGNCRDCPLSIMTLRAGIERFIIKKVPEVSRVESVK